MRISDLIREAALLGPRRFAFRVGWEVTNRTGLRAMLEPIAEYPSPTTEQTHADWFERLAENHPLRCVRSLIDSGKANDALESLYSERELQRIVDGGDAVESGEVTYFQAFTEAPGTPPNWHLEPRMRRSWPRSIHWSTLISHEDRNGDIKLTWELNRFLHTYDLIRAYAVDRKPSRVVTFLSHLRSWEEANPFRAGVNWSSGQELAIRVLSWSYGVAAFGGASEFSESDFQRFRRLSYAHGIQIESQLDFARAAVANNHLLAEALGLYIIGSMFDFDESSRWREVGASILDELPGQFDEDGGYCQNSHTYARFALQMWLEVIRWRPEGRYSVLPAIRRAASQLRVLSSPAGRLPNWGNNDGSTLNRWSSADYQDFRPTLDALDWTCGVPINPTPESAEHLMWLFDERTPDESAETSGFASRADFTATGLFLRRAGETRAIARCGPMHQRTGHADQMHVDVWFGDREVACDAGSYSYHYESTFHRWASGLSSHNVVTVGEREPMVLLRKFKWQGFAPARVGESSENGLKLTWPLYEKLFGVRWERSVAVWNDRVTVRDNLVSVDGRSRSFRLHWLLVGTEWARNGGLFRCRGVEVDIQSSGTIDVVVGTDGVSRGWHSRYYGVREPCTSVAVLVSSASETIVTDFRCQAPL